MKKLWIINKLVTHLKPVTARLQVAVWPWVWIFETAPIPVSPVTIIPQCDLHPCHTLDEQLTVYYNKLSV